MAKSPLETFQLSSKKIIRQQDEDSSAVRNTRQPSHLKTDKAFIIDGMRELPVQTQENDDRESDEESVDSVTNFDMQAHVCQDRFDEETYEDYNESRTSWIYSPEFHCRRRWSKLSSIKKEVW